LGLPLLAFISLVTFYSFCGSAGDKHHTSRQMDTDYFFELVPQKLLSTPLTFQDIFWRGQPVR
jgi:hypothetical protein